MLAILNSFRYVVKIGDIRGAVAFSAKNVGAVGAFEGIVCSLIKSFGMKCKGNFPYRKNNNRSGAKAPGEKSGNKNNGRKHHHVVPVKNPAGGAAAVFHKPNAERAPEKNADKVADVKSDGKNKKHVSSDNSAEIKRADCGDKREPDKADLNSVAVAFFDIGKKIFKVSDVFDFSRNEIFKAEF